jgi:gluconate 2-dehydrogenase gamma chain
MRSAFTPDDALLFLNLSEAATIEALTSQIIPSEEDSPGAREAGVVIYIDRSLAGFMRDLQPMYRNGLRELADLIARRHGGVLFQDLAGEQQRDIVAHLDEVARNDPDDRLGQFFRVVREHTIQGFFGDPAYGGNRDVVGWKLVGFPGAQWGYTPEQMQPGVDAKSIPIFTVKDLYIKIGGAR